DVRQGAVALTGWQLPRPDSTAAANGTGRMLPVYTSHKSGVFNQRRAFKGSVTYLGKTGALDTQGVIDRILAQPSTAPFITTRVLQHVVARQPSSTLVNRLADAFRRSKYDMKTLMRSVFTSDEFLAAGTYRALVKSPTEFMVQAARALDATKLSKLIVASGSGMGQMLFDPPDVGAGAAGLAAGYAAVPDAFARAVYAAKQEGITNEKVLVMIQLAGGNDGLRTLVPLADPTLHDLRPKLAAPMVSQALPLNKDYGLNHNLPGIKGLWDKGKVAIV